MANNYGQIGVMGGPGVSVDSDVAKFDGTSGWLLKDGGAGGGGGGTIGAPVVGGNPGSVLFVDAMGNLGQNAGFQFDGSNFTAPDANFTGQVGSSSSYWSFAQDGSGYFANQALLWDPDGTLHLNHITGSAGSSSYIHLETGQLIDGFNVASIDWNTRLLYSGGASIRMDWDAATLSDGSGPTLRWGDTQLMKSTTTQVTLNWGSRVAYDENDNTTFDWNGSNLVTDGGPSIDWKNQRLNTKNFAFTTTLDWGVFKAYDQTALNTLDWTLGELYSSDHSSTVYKSLSWTDRVLVGTDGVSVSLNWDTYELRAGGFTRINWDGNFANDSLGVSSYDWEARDMNDSFSLRSLSWEDRVLTDPDGVTTVIDWANRHICDVGGGVLINFYGGLGFFSVDPITQPSGDVATALVALGLMSSAIVNPKVVMTLDNGSTVTFNNNSTDETIYDTTASTTATLTINLPTTSRPGQIVRYVTARVATVVTLGGGSVIVGSAVTTLAANASVAWQSTSSGAFIRIQ